MSQESTKELGALTPEELLATAASTPEGITVKFIDTRKRNVMRTLLYRLILKTRDNPTMGWEHLRITNIGPFALHISDPTLTSYGITEITKGVPK